MAETFVWLLAVVGLCLLAGWQLHRRSSDASRRRERRPVATTQMPPNSVVDESRLLAVDELRVSEEVHAADRHDADEQEQAEQQRLLAEFEAAQRAQDGTTQSAQDEQAAADAARAEEEQLAAIYAEAQREAERQAEEQRLRDELESARRAEAERAEAERIEAARIEVERIEAERAEAERIEAERIEAERVEAERLERQRIEAERVEQERIAAEAHAEAQRQAEQQQRLRAEFEAAQRAEQEAAQRAWAEQQALAATQAATPPRVLVVDDSKVVRIKTGRLLAQHQIQVAYAVDGVDAVQQLHDAVPDLVITDVEMPGMDGFELTRHIRADARTARLPVIMITAADDRHREHAEAVGVSVLLGKPYGEDALIAHIRHALGHGAALPAQAELQDALA
jgi:PleD family two-component response regulator